MSSDTIYDRIVFSLVIPVYNEHDGIRDCLDCIVAQTRLPDEVIVVDNNSTDDTMGIVEEYRDRLPLKVIFESRQGVAWARETGFNAAKGDIIGRIDADTRIDPSWTAAAIDYLGENPEVGAINGSSYLYGVNRGSGRKAVLAGAAVARETPILPRTLQGNNCALRKEAWEAAGPNIKDAPGTHEDVDLSFALIETGHTLHTVPAMVASLSPRRNMASASSTLKYLNASVRTQWVHGLRKDAAIQGVLIPLNMAILAGFKLVLLIDGQRNARRVSPVTQ